MPATVAPIAFGHVRSPRRTLRLLQQVSSAQPDERRPEEQEHHREGGETLVGVQVVDQRDDEHEHPHTEGEREVVCGELVG